MEKQQQIEAIRLTPAPSFSSQISKAYIDQLVKNNLKDEKQAIWARVYFYRTRLNLEPEKVAQMLSISELLVNHIAKDFGESKPPVIARLDANLDQWFPRDLLQAYKDHLEKIQLRIKKRIFA